MKSLLIISDTPFYIDKGGCKVFEPTLREIEEVSELFSEIKWISYLRVESASLNARVPRVSKITLVPIDNMRGGKTLLKKLKVLVTIPKQIRLFYSQISSFDVVHTRAPSVPAMLVIIYSFFDSKRLYWHKYAGNWAEKNSPLTYRFQHWLLRKLNRPNVRITINGEWPGLHRGFMFMENPCFRSDYLENLKSRKNERDYHAKLKVCFVGNLAPFKGAMRLVNALTSSQISPAIDSFYIVGDGEETAALQEIASRAKFPINLLGYLSREEIFQNVYNICHIIVLPSESEGFPKVISEAAGHKCIPVVTSVSSIGQYIKDGINGFLLKDSSAEEIKNTFVNRILSHTNLEEVANRSFEMSYLFTYERFRGRIKQEVLGE